MSDIISDIDGIPRRTAVDKNVNQHGHTLIDFLIDSKVCVLNGRFDNNTDNSTSMSIRGRSVVDFVCVPHDCFNSCANFEVISPASIIDDHNLQSLLGERSSISDHNFLRFTYKYTIVSTENENDEENVSQRIPFNTKLY